MTKNEFFKKYAARIRNVDGKNGEPRFNSTLYFTKYLHEVHDWPYNSFYVTDGYYKTVVKAYDGVLFQTYMSFFVRTIDEGVDRISQQIHEYKVKKAQSNMEV